MLFGPHNDIDLYKKLLALGITDYFSDSATPEQVLQSIERSFSEVDPAAQARVIAFIGAGGGVGSSVTAANTAYNLAQLFNEKVILVDFDLAFGSSSLDFNLSAKQTVSDALAHPDRLDDILIERFLVPYNEYLSILTSPASLIDQQEVEIESIEKLLQLVRQLANFIVLDLPHAWQPWVQELLLQVDEAVVVSYPNLAGIRNTKNILDFLGEGRGVDAPTRLIFNRVGASRKTELGIKDSKGAIDQTPLLSIPYDPVIFGTAMNNGELVSEANRSHRITQRFKLLSETVSGRTVTGTSQSKRSMFSLRSSR